MSKGTPAREHIWILVKAYPQPSKRYGETVCCAGITRDGQRFLRLYPVRYRHLSPENRFNRYDLVELDIFKATSDFRPESFKVSEDSIRLVQGERLSNQAKVRLWKPFVAASLTELKRENVETKRSLGIIRPDPGSVRFIAKPAAEASSEDREVAEAAYRNASLFDEPLKKLQRPVYAFYYRFTSGDREHRMQIHDWEVQAAWVNYLRQYRTHEAALERLTNEYQNNIPKQNLHLLMGTMLKRPRQFMIIGLLRSSINMDMLEAQPDLFQATTKPL